MHVKIIHRGRDGEDSSFPGTQNTCLITGPAEPSRLSKLCHCPQARSLPAPNIQVCLDSCKQPQPAGIRCQCFSWGSWLLVQVQKKGGQKIRMQQIMLPVTSGRCCHSGQKATS